jgi:hypothetical protein
MKISETRTGDVFINPIDFDCAYLLLSVDVVGEHATYGWFNLITGCTQHLAEKLELDIAPEWIVFRNDVIMQNASLTMDWQEIQEVAA